MGDRIIPESEFLKQKQIIIETLTDNFLNTKLYIDLIICLNYLSLQLPTYVYKLWWVIQIFNLHAISQVIYNF